jgi:hypothetical protein
LPIDHLVEAGVAIAGGRFDRMELAADADFLQLVDPDRRRIQVDRQIARRTLTAIRWEVEFIPGLCYFVKS